MEGMGHVGSARGRGDGWLGVKRWGAPRVRFRVKVLQPWRGQRGVGLLPGTRQGCHPRGERGTQPLG